MICIRCLRTDRAPQPCPTCGALHCTEAVKLPIAVDASCLADHREQHRLAAERAHLHATRDALR